MAKELLQIITHVNPGQSNLPDFFIFKELIYKSTNEGTLACNSCDLAKECFLKYKSLMCVEFSIDHLTDHIVKGPLKRVE